MYSHQSLTAGGTHQITLVRHDPDLPASRVLYLLDGNAALEELRPHWLEQHPNTALVAIGYPGTERFDLDRRSLDYTPAPPPQWDGGSRKALARPHGGAAAFLAALSGDIVPTVEKLLGAQAPQRELWGHSYGGLFALWMLGQDGHGFAELHAASPSLWWGDYELERQFLDKVVLSQDVRHVSLSMGDREISRTGERLYDPERLAKLAIALRGTPGLECTVTILNGASHGAAFGLALEMAIRDNRPNNVAP